MSEKFTGGEVLGGAFLFALLLLISWGIVGGIIDFRQMKRTKCEMRWELARTATDSILVLDKCDPR